MKHAWSTLRMLLAALAITGGGLAGGGCEERPEAGEEAVPDARLEAHAVVASTPTAEGLAYLREMAKIHERADAAADANRAAEILREGLSLTAPAKLGEAEILRLELAARLGETLLPGRAREAREVLAGMLPPDRSLPIDRASAHALVVLGDASLAEGDDALAAGSYARAIRMMSILRQELKP